jgi:hypothetical protein
LIQIRITGNRGFDRISGIVLIFQEIAQADSREGPWIAASPEWLFPAFPFGEYMNA